MNENMSYILEFLEVGEISLLDLPPDKIKEFVKALMILKPEERTRLLEDLLREMDFL